MQYDCAIIGGGPAGLNAALVLGRARRNIILFDNNKPRNAVTHESHGFITRDGVKPSEFRMIAHREISRYPSAEIANHEITAVSKDNDIFQLMTREGRTVEAKNIILATGLKEILPDISGIHDFYGTSLFSCPYCDGWELRDKRLVIISEGQNIFHMAKLVHNWSRDIILCTNGQQNLTSEQKAKLQSKNIQVFEQRISGFIGQSGHLQQVTFEDGSTVNRAGGFVTPVWVQAVSFGERLGCETNQMGGYVTDSYGKTNIHGVYAAGDASVIAPAQLIIAAAEGSRAAIGVNTALTEAEFE
ncbi:NAD(P)/FAD-dependent oxidoreductase [Paenibacillus radicis (ex Xue et al. 2023)]|uniref:NAD(P)/FAD-dependent oxidoreductase n=1 Tax=Paenibacillus radicis (ex Xue et al. 2023) TaxID=2972489 RepID=A0ABT1Y970_9BACL|nr:NAD(P)/FAD-dependent oxidoreductase [Paenibacillus radicis (ex Xue et al. 2023)]MCR8629731.1 NAD(P)/FAD-dependent oxidoreductase [Paenibacillus radicis (ex Xue et al. 2023)]